MEKLIRIIGWILAVIGAATTLIWMLFSKTSILTSSDITLSLAVFVFFVGLLFVGLGYFLDPRLRLKKIGYIIWLHGLGLVIALCIFLIAVTGPKAGSVMGAILGGALAVACLVALTVVGPRLVYVVQKEKKEMLAKGSG